MGIAVGVVVVAVGSGGAMSGLRGGGNRRLCLLLPHLLLRQLCLWGRLRPGLRWRLLRIRCTGERQRGRERDDDHGQTPALHLESPSDARRVAMRSEERRVGKGCRVGWWGMW